MAAPSPAPVVSRAIAAVQPHSPVEDAQALFAGTLFVSLALLLYNKAGLLTGGTAGAAFLLHYATGWSFGKLFFAINLPFYWFAWRRMGREFTLKTFASVSLLSLLADWSPTVFRIETLHPAYAAIAGGFLLGTGCLFLARHRASLGGATIVALYLQDHHGIRAGKVQLAIDCCIVLLALFVVDPARVAWSILGAAVMGIFLWLNHRPGRYTAL
ncbi:YitT family protein [uncultured Ramlibacter sp.]|uniref:YitT family protein n=1 Tax=uncultured Ramlibacter sp. TaxID=260755 RepID=UPI002627A5C1|nr:YitT family protein [uncultured Ramlibacter sp.]